MVPNAVIATKIARRSPFLYRLPCFSSKPTSEFNTNTIIRANPLHRSGGNRSCHRLICLNPTISGFKELGSAQIQFKKLGFDCFRVFAVSSGGSGGGNGGFGGSGGGSSGDGAAGSSGGGGQNWSLLSWYLSLLEKHPVMTKALTSAILTFIGDMICQIAIDQVPSFDWKRTFLFTLVGLVLVGPTLHFWYLYLSKLITATGALGAFKRLLLDQFLFAPTFIGVVLSTLVTLEGRPQQAIPKLQQEWFSSVLANWQLWIPFQFLNFRFVPQQFQVLAANFVALIWNVILSYKAHKEVLTK